MNPKCERCSKPATRKIVYEDYKHGGSSNFPYEEYFCDEHALIAKDYNPVVQDLKQNRQY